MPRASAAGVGCGVQGGTCARTPWPGIQPRQPRSVPSARNAHKEPGWSASRPRVRALTAQVEPGQVLPHPAIRQRCSSWRAAPQSPPTGFCRRRTGRAISLLPGCRAGAPPNPTAGVSFVTTDDIVGPDLIRALAFLFRRHARGKSPTPCQARGDGKQIAVGSSRVSPRSTPSSSPVACLP